MASPPPQSSAIRLALLHVGVVTLAVAALLATVFLVTQRELAREVDRAIAAELDELRERYDSAGLAPLVESLQRRSETRGRSGALYLLIDASGNRVAGNLPAWPDAAPRAARWIDFDLKLDEPADAASHPARAAVHTFDSHHLLVGTDVGSRHAVAVRLRDALAWSTLLAALLSGLAGWWYSRRVAARVRAAARACDEILSGDSAGRLPARAAGDEFDQLASAINRALEHAEQQMLAARATFSGAARELRAPLHRLRMRLESLAQRTAGEEMREALGAALGDLERAQRTLATLLQIAHAAADTPLSQAERIDLAELARSMVELYAPAAREAGLALAVHAAGSCPVTGNRQLLAQLLTSLLENALKFVPAGGAVEVSVAAQGDGGAQLSVADNGPGIAPTQRAAALEPFGRLERDAARPGSGLGLSLVAAVMRLHHGRVELAERTPGLVVRCEFPPAGPGGVPRGSGSG
jgi:signal transduction histidine kinase